jgi:hypothetical protein
MSQKIFQETSFQISNVNFTLLGQDLFDEKKVKEKYRSKKH